MTPLPIPVKIIESPGRVVAIKKDAPDVKWDDKPETEPNSRTKIVDMVTEKLVIGDDEFDFETLEKFKKDTGKRPIYGGKVTKAFREWLDQKHA